MADLLAGPWVAVVCTADGAITQDPDSVPGGDWAVVAILRPDAVDDVARALEGGDGPDATVLLCSVGLEHPADEGARIVHWARMRALAALLNGPQVTADEPVHTEPCTEAVSAGCGALGAVNAGTKF